MTDGAKLEKISAGLKCHFTGDCDKCPYDHEYADWMYVCDELVEDATAWLDSMKPRVIPLEEIHRGMAVWLEDIDKKEVVLAIGGASCAGCKCFITEKDLSIAPKDVDYNRRWRAWTAPPTNAQRKAVKWK